MLKSKEVTLSTGAVTLVTEITVAQVLTVLQNAGGKDPMLAGLDLLYITTGLTAKDVMTLTESDLVSLWDACREIHDFFFEMAKQINLRELLPLLITTLLQPKSTGKSSGSPLKAAAPSTKSPGGVTGILKKLVSG